MTHFCNRMLAILLVLILMASPALCEPLVRTAEDAARVMAAWSTLESDGEGEATAEALGRSSWKKKVKMLNWYKGGSSVLRKGQYGYIYDVKTGALVEVPAATEVGKAR